MRRRCLLRNPLVDFILFMYFSTKVKGILSLHLLVLLTLQRGNNHLVVIVVNLSVGCLTDQQRYKETNFDVERDKIRRICQIFSYQLFVD